MKQIPILGPEIRALADTLVTEELVVVPVRHHSPVCALAVDAAIERFRPSKVLVEGPRSFDGLIDLLVHPEAQMPLAVYAWARPAAKAGAVVRRADAHGGYYPFCDYSPELIALRRAREAGIPVGFCDLEVAEQAASASEPVLPGDGTLLEERGLRMSDALRALATQVGCRDEEDLWELLLETGDPTTSEGWDTHHAAMVAYCALARSTTSTTDLAADGTTVREAEMVHHLRAALAARKQGDGPVLAVLGGFHAVAVPDLLATPGERPTYETEKLDQGAALIRYTFDRLERLGGYASGMTAPGWHQRIWDQRREGVAGDRARRDAVLSTLLDLAAELRTRHIQVPTPSLAAAHQQTLMLADLRERPAPLRSDLLDGALGSLVKGEADTEGALVMATAVHVLTGSRAGRVPPGAGTPPLVRDTMVQLETQRLDTEGVEHKNAALDLYRNHTHRRTSRLLHGLQLLGVPFADHVAGPDFVRGTELSRLQERWRYLWTPSTEGRLVECSILGSTLAEAVATCFAELLAEATADGTRPSSARATELLAQCLVVGLHEDGTTVDASVTLVRDAIAAEGQLVDAVTAAARLALILEGREVLEASRISDLPELVRAAYDRCLYLAAELTASAQEAVGVVGALSRLRELLASAGGADLDPDPFWGIVEHLRTDHPTPFVRGAAAGLLATAERLDSETLARDVAGHLDSSLPAAESVAYVSGLFATARESAWQAGGLVPALDERMRGWDGTTFLKALPELRLAFSGLTPRETDRVAEIVAGIHGAPVDHRVRRDVSAADVERHLAASEAVLAALGRDGLTAWAGVES